jgi:hypothetical protein
MIPLAFIHSGIQAEFLAVPIGLMGGVATAAYIDLAMRSCPPGLQGTLMMMVDGVLALSGRGGDLLGTKIYDVGKSSGFVYCVIATTVVYALILPLIALIPKQIVSTADGEENPVIDAEVLREVGLSPKAPESFPVQLDQALGLKTHNSELRPTAKDVFISYSKEDKAIADALCGNLERRGIHCWIAPRNVAVSSNWAESIIQAIEASKVMVLVFSRAANDSPQVSREVQTSFESGKPVFPVRIDQAEPTGAMKFYLPSVHWLDLVPGPGEEHFEALASSLRSVLDVTERESGETPDGDA